MLKRHCQNLRCNKCAKMSLSKFIHVTNSKKMTLNKLHNKQVRVATECQKMHLTLYNMHIL